jgi:hypothetical protein
MNHPTSRPAAYFIDTTVVYYRLHSHSLLREAVRQAVGDRTMKLSVFVRGEYIRGYVIGLIELYFAIKAEASVEDGIQLFNAEMGKSRNLRKVANAFLATCGWLCGFEDWRDVPKALRRLGEFIRNTLSSFDATFFTRIYDPLECEIGVLSFPRETYRENHLLDFYNEYERIRDHPNCNQCRFREEQVRELKAAGIDLFSDQQRQQHKESTGYVGQAGYAAMAVKSTRKGPSCWYCDRLSDTIIALSAPPDTTILTGDRGSFPVLASLLKKPLRLIPSLDELRSKRDGH